MAKLEGTITVADLPPHRRLIVSLCFFNVEAADAPAPIGGAPLPEAVPNEPPVAEKGDLSTESFQSSYALPFLVEKPAGDYHLLVQMKLFRTQEDGVFEQAEQFFAPPLVLTEKVTCCITLKVQWPQTLLALQNFSNEQRLAVIWDRQVKIGVWGAILSIAYMLLYQTPLFTLINVNAAWWKGIAVFLLCIWTIGPAFWFSYETHWLLSRADKQFKKERMNEFKVGQDSAKAFWVAVALLIALL